MKQLKMYEYEADNFLRGKFITYAPHRVRKHIRHMVGFITYMRIRKYITIKEVKENVE